MGGYIGCFFPLTKNLPSKFRSQSSYLEFGTRGEGEGERECPYWSNQRGFDQNETY